MYFSITVLAENLFDSAPTVTSACKMGLYKRLSPLCSAKSINRIPGQVCRLSEKFPYTPYTVDHTLARGDGVLGGNVFLPPESRQTRGGICGSYACT